MIQKSIYGYTWQFFFVPSADKILIKDDGSTSIGATLYSSQRIFILETLAPDVAKATLRHEISHVITETMILGKDQFSIEELCDFVGAYAPYITRLANNIYKCFRKEQK